MQFSQSLAVISLRDCIVQVNAHYCYLKMQRILIIVLSILFYNPAISQDNELLSDDSARTVRVKVGFSVNAEINQEEVYFTPSIVFGNKFHQLSIGPRFPRLGMFLMDEQVALSSGYRYYPNTQIKKANLFFSYNLIFNRYSIDGVRYCIDNDCRTPKSYMEFSNTLGMGYEIKLFSRLYIYYHVDLGIGFSRTAHKIIDPYSEKFFAYRIGLGLSYKQKNINNTTANKN